MKLSVSGVTATGFYVTGLVVGSTFGFVAGILFVVVAFLLSKVFGKKEKEIAATSSNGTQPNDPNNNGAEEASTFQA